MLLHVVALAAALMAGSLPSTTADILPNIRTSNPYLSDLIAHAREHSPTLAMMVERVEQSDIIIYFEAVPKFEDGLRGCIHFVGAAGTHRYIRAQIKTMMNRYDIIASLAHELQHALEIAAHYWVRDEPTLAELYRHIGHERDVRRFETDEAQTAGRAVRAEVLGAL